MKTPPPALSLAFDREHASAYDERWKPVRALSEALHLLARGALTELPVNARILCAGVGTGAEMLSLGAAFREWRFVGFDPSGAMLDICRTRLADAGMLDRCALHHGYIETLAPGEPFDAATSFLVSHFITDAGARGAFFRAIAERLRPGGIFVNADLAAEREDPSYNGLMDVWLSTLSLAGMDEEKRRQYREMFGTAVAAHSPSEVESLIAANGFTAPIRFYQAALINGWVCRRV